MPRGLYSEGKGAAGGVQDSHRPHLTEVPEVWPLLSVTCVDSQVRATMAEDSMAAQTQPVLWEVVPNGSVQGCNFSCKPSRVQLMAGGARLVGETQRHYFFY